jgi:hypothetical protein
MNTMIDRSINQGGRVPCCDAAARSDTCEGIRGDLIDTVAKRLLCV